MATEEASLYLKFITDGVQQGTQQIRQMGAALDKTSLAGMAFETMQKQIRGTAREAEALNGLLKSGNYEMLSRAGARNDARLAQMQRLARSADIMVQKERVLTGEYEREVRGVMALGKEQERLAAAQRKVQLQVTHGKAAASLTLLQEKLQGVGKAGTIGFGILTAGIGGWVRAGMQGTAEAQRLTQGMQLLSREIANIFAPWIQKAVLFVERLAMRFRSLSAEQQESIRKWVAFGAVLSGTLMILPRVVGAMAALAKVSHTLGLARAAQSVAGLVGSAGGAGGAAGAAGALRGLGPVGLAAGAVVGLLAASKEGREVLGDLWKATEPLLTAFGQLAASIGTALLPVIKGLSQAIAWVINNVPGLKPSKGGAGFGAAGAAAGFALGGPLGAGAGYVLGNLFGAARDKAFEGDFDASGLEIKEVKARLKKMEGVERSSGVVGQAQDEYRRRLEDRLKELEAGGKGKTALTAAGSGIEGVTDLYRRLAGAVGKDWSQKTAEGVEGLNKQFEEVKNMVKKLVDELERQKGREAAGG